MALKLRGVWDLGFALAFHTESSVFLGDGPFGPEFDTEYTEVGGALYRLKYRGDESGLPMLVRRLKAVYDRHIVPEVGRAHWVIPVPPTARRRRQPLYVLVEAFCEATGVPDGRELLARTRATPSLKNVFDPTERKEALDGAFEASARVRGKRVVILDDIYRSGATASEVATAVRAQGTSAVCLLAVTRTRALR